MGAEDHAPSAAEVAGNTPPPANEPRSAPPTRPPRLPAAGPLRSALSLSFDRRSTSAPEQHRVASSFRGITVGVADRDPDASGALLQSCTNRRHGPPFEAVGAVSCSPRFGSGGTTDAGGARRLGRSTKTEGRQEDSPKKRVNRAAFRRAWGQASKGASCVSEADRSHRRRRRMRGPACRFLRKERDRSSRRGSICATEGGH
jgi:hypothetical protein